MISPTDLCRIFLETFDKGAVDVFRAWLSQHPSVNKWMIGADFALRDTSRPGDCFAFSIIPYDKFPKDFSAEVGRNLPRDLKDSKTIDPLAAAWLRDRRHFHIAIPMEQTRVLYDNGPGTKQQEVARESIRLMLQHMVAHQRSDDSIRRMRAALQKAQANRFNVGLFTDLSLLALYLPLVTLILARERKPEVVGWFCDRDSMISWGESVVWDLALENLAGLGEIWGVRGLSPVIACPDRSSGREIMWYDDYIRAADWLAGTLAAWNRRENRLPEGQDKYLRMVEDVLADSDNLLVLPVKLGREGAAVSNVLVRRAETTGKDQPTDSQFAG